MVKDGLNDGLLALEIKARPLPAQYPAGAGQFVDRGVGSRSDLAAGLLDGIVKLFENACGAVDVSGLGCGTY
jgi:hypothetical protein